MTMPSRPSAGDLADALAIFGRWVGSVDPDRAPMWADRLQVNAKEIALLRDSPPVEGPAYCAIPVAVQAPRTDPTAQSERMSGPDAETGLRKARELHGLCMFTQLVTSVDTPAIGYLKGAPFAVKDLIGVAVMQRSGGSASGSTEPYPKDSTAVAALRRHGGVIIGLANLHELAFGASSANPVYGAVVNPAAPGCIPGGSSGGSAAVVAAGVVPVALGTDTGGSIRIPAACCGVVGFKPTYDAVSRNGVIEVASSLDHVGPLGRSVLDCAIAFSALCDLDPFPGLPDRPLDGVRVARLGGYFESPLHQDVRNALDDACARMSTDGAQLGSATVDGVELASAIYFAVVHAEAACSHEERLRHCADAIGEDVRLRLEIGSFLPAHWYLKAQRMRRKLADALDAQFAAADVLVCATLRAPAPRIGATSVTIDGKQYSLHAGMADLTIPFSLAGLPAISVPWGVSGEGVPLALQVVGARGQDWKVLQVARRMEALRSLGVL